MKFYSLFSKAIKKSYRMKILMIFLFMIILLPACKSPKSTEPGITFVTPRNPNIHNIYWSPIDENMILMNANTLGLQPALVYLFDLKTGHKNILAQAGSDHEFMAVWMYNGTHILVRPNDKIKGFDEPGWYMLDINNKSSEFLLNSNEIAWSPDGKTIATTQITQKDSNTLNLSLIDVNTKTKEIIYTKNGASFSFGLSWSPDNRYLVFSMDLGGIGQSGFEDLYILDIKTRQVSQITENGTSSNPVWSPKGKIIAYEEHTPDPYTYTRNLHLISPDGKCDLEIPNLDAWSPTWSPDGEKLGYISVDGVYYLELKKVFGRDIYQNLCQ
jgi:dipeptidyl aminopeptidase/acylaminoacyl peptidase